MMALQSFRLSQGIVLGSLEGFEGFERLAMLLDWRGQDSSIEVEAASANFKT